jgi:hypothetical protein
MLTGGIKIWFKKNTERVDWNLLIFLLLFLNVKLAVKLAGLVFIYIRRFDLSFRFSTKQNGLSYFYPAMIGIAIINTLFLSLYREQNYLILLMVGVLFWVISILALHQVSLSVMKTDIQKIHFTLLLFFILNALASFGNLFSIILEIKEWNPYRYQGLYQKYFIGTGDYIRGISFDTSTTNALLNAFGAVYFLSRKQMIMGLVCMSVILLTGSNFTNLLMIACLAGFFIYRSDRGQKSIIIVMLMLLVIFMTNISPQNNKYATYIVEKTFGHKDPVGKLQVKEIPITEKADSVLTPDERKEKHAKLYLDSVARLRNAIVLLTSDYNKKVGNDSTIFFVPVIPKVNIHAPEYQHRQDSSEARLQAVAFLYKIQQEGGENIFNADALSLASQPPGKLIAYRQLIHFIKDHPQRMITGNGMGNFSSKLAFRATGLKIAGGYPSSYTYIGEDFRKNHLSVYLSYFGKDSGYHSIANSPNSFYAQLFGEYGLAGVAVFILFYLLYFARGCTKLTYGLPVLFIMLGALITDYWFEQLSIVIMFELMILLNRRELKGINTDHL